MAVPLGFRLTKREKSFEGFKAAVAYGLFAYLSRYQPQPGRDQFREIGVELPIEPSMQRYIWAFIAWPCDIWQLKVRTFTRTVYWHVQYILKLGGYLNDKNKNDA